MLNLKALRNFNNGKGLIKKEGDTFEASKEEAKRLLEFKLAEKVEVSHKKIVKK